VRISNPGIVDHDIEPAELVHGSVNPRLQVGKPAHVDFHADRLGAEFDDLLLERRRGRLPVSSGGDRGWFG
jgi:hypothetical protein